MLIAIVHERIDKRGHTRYIVRWRYIADEKPFYIMGGRPWSDKDLALLIENKHDIAKVAKLLGRSEEACREKLSRLGITIKNVRNVTCVIFPKDHIDRRKAIINQVLPRLKVLLNKVDKAEELAPETINDLAKIVRAVAALFSALEKWETGEEMLEIIRGGEDAASEEPSG